MPTKPRDVASKRLVGLGKGCPLDTSFGGDSYLTKNDLYQLTRTTATEFPDAPAHLLSHAIVNQSASNNLRLQA